MINKIQKIISKIYILLHISFGISIKNRIKENENEIIGKKLKQGYCIFLMFNIGKGEAFIFFNFKEQIEKKLNVKIFPVLAATNKAVVKVCGYKGPLLYISDIGIIPKLRCIKDKYGNLGENWAIDISKKSPNIAKSDFYYYTAMISVYRNKRKKIITRWIDDIKDILDLPQETALGNSYNLNNCTNFINKIKYKKTIMICPESNCLAHRIGYQLFNDNFINTLSKFFKQRGYDIIYNSINEIQGITEAQWINKPLEEIIKIASCCHRVISVRSGICDILHGLNRKLIVINPNDNFKKFFNINYSFKANVQEYIFDDVCQNIEEFGELCLKE